MLHGFSAIDENVFFSFVDFDLVEDFRLREGLLQALPNENGHILSGAHRIGEVGDILVQIFMVQWLHNCDIHTSLQIMDIHHHSCATNYWSSEGHFHHVVMAMPVRVVAFPVS